MRLDSDKMNGNDHLDISQNLECASDLEDEDDTTLLSTEVRRLSLSEELSFLDSSSEDSSFLCVSLSEPHSESAPPPLLQTTESEVDLGGWEKKRGHSLKFQGTGNTKISSSYPSQETGFLLFRESYGTLSRGGSSEWLDASSEPEDENLGRTFQVLPSLDPNQEKEMYKSFEAEFLANTQMDANWEDDFGGPQMQPQEQQQQQQQLPLADPNVTDSAYSSSNSSTSSLNVGNKMGVLPDLRGPKKPSAKQRPCPSDYGSVLSELQVSCRHLNYKDQDLWGNPSEPPGNPRKPVLSSSLKDNHFLSTLNDLRDKGILNSKELNSRDLNPGHLNARHHLNSTGLKSDHANLDDLNARDPLDSGTHNARGIPNFGNSRMRLDSDKMNGNDHLDISQNLECASDLEDEDDTTLLSTEVRRLSLSEELSFLDSSSEDSSSLYVSLSEPRSESAPPPLLQTTESEVVLHSKSLKKPERVPSIYKLKLRPIVRHRTDNRPEKTPSRIPTPISYKKNASEVPNCPQNSKSNGHPKWGMDHKSRKALYQAFTELLDPRAESPTEEQKGCSSVESFSLDEEA
ncbi:UNVERIFIED_CONTAM: hypothetical protein FKN15_000713 [Acipenser sinensis]